MARTRTQSLGRTTSGGQPQHAGHRSIAHGVQQASKAAEPLGGWVRRADDFVFHNAPVALCLLSAQPSGHGRILRTNVAFCDLMQRTEQQLLGSRIVDLLHPQERQGRGYDLPEPAQGGGSGLAGPTPSLVAARQFEWTFRRPDDSYWVGQCRIAVPPDHPAVQVMAVHDVTRHMQEVNSLRMAALHDPLTSLPNRSLLMDRLEHALKADARARRSVSVFYIDLDNFKFINDTHGHASGDVVLREVAARLSGAVRAGDTVGRLGGDEFVVVAPSLGADLTPMLQRRLAESLFEHITVGDSISVSVGASIGSVTSRVGETSCEELLAAADSAMYQSKRLRKRLGVL